ncbi:MAG: hypothetical protein CVT75_03650 [Alphaproteobacteria bacterium HGW-Alphaproteobacteria-14]|nr:MAG: hypothetical protein CVT75_03650 [Alphaproteobacteria bacterium HGW-Alphaproteobacteria-14]
MLEKFIERGPFVTGPLSVWRFVNLGACIPAGISAPGISEPSDDGTPLIEWDGDVVSIHFHDVARFRINFEDRSITGFDISPETADCVITHILHDHIAPRLLAELGELVLHASAVRFGDRLALFLGQSGAGKSTLATSLHQAGYNLLGDDAAIVTHGVDGFLAQTVYPSLRLFPEAIANLLGDDAATSPMADYSDKQHVHLPTIPEVAGDPMPLAAIFFLSGECGATEAVAAPMDSTRACIALVEQSFSLDPKDPRCGARRLAGLSRLALEVPAYRLSYPHDFDRLGAVHQIIEAIMTKHRPILPADRRGSLSR